MRKFSGTMRLVKAEFKAASGGLDELVKSVENMEKDKKLMEIQKYFNMEMSNKLKR